MADIKYKPVSHDHEAFLKKASKRKEFKKAYDDLEEEYRLTREMVLKVSGGREIAERFPEFCRRLALRLPMLNQVNREQVDLLRRYRLEPEGEAKDHYRDALLQSINCIAAGFGATG